jgi:hypothetical protein
VSRRLAVCVTTREGGPHALALAPAAVRAGVEVEIFLTGEGVHLTRDSGFPDLLKWARVGVCEVSYIAAGYQGQPVPGLRDKDFTTQARHAEIVAECDRYVIL